LKYKKDERKIINGKWNPWNPVVTAVLKRRINPVPNV